MRALALVLLLTLTTCAPKPYPRFIYRDGKPAVRVTVNVHGPACVRPDGKRTLIIRADYPESVDPVIAVRVDERMKVFEFAHGPAAVLTIEAGPGVYAVVIGTKERPYLIKRFWVYDCRPARIQLTK